MILFLQEVSSHYSELNIIFYLDGIKAGQHAEAEHLPRVRV